MASIATNEININLYGIEKILVEGNANLCAYNQNECKKPKIANIDETGVKISDDPEYQYGLLAQSVYNKCFPAPITKINITSCRLCFYKLDKDEKKRKAMLRRPVNKRRGAKSKEGHGKTFESNVNECISANFAPPPHTLLPDEFLSHQKDYITNVRDKYPDISEIKLPIFSKTFIPFLEHPNDPLDVSVQHFHAITTKFRVPTAADKVTQQLYPNVKTALDLHEGYVHSFEQQNMMSVMGSGINIKYFESTEKKEEKGPGKWYPKRMDMANYLTWWNDTRNKKDLKISTAELQEIYGEDFNREITFEILPFALMLGCWNEIKDTTTKIEYKCGQGCWIVKFQYDEKGKCPAVNRLWGDPTQYPGMSEKDFKKLLFQLAKIEKRIREDQQNIKNDWLNKWHWPPKNKVKVVVPGQFLKDGSPKFKTKRLLSQTPDDEYIDGVDKEILKLIFRWYGPVNKIGENGKINPNGMKNPSAFYSFVNFPDFKKMYWDWSDNPEEIYYKDQKQSLTEIVGAIKDAITAAGGLHTLGPKIFSYKGTEIIDNKKIRDKIKNKKIKDIFPRDCRAPQGNLTQTNIVTFLTEMEKQGQAIYIPKIHKGYDLYRLFAPIQYNWIDKVTSKIYSLMELKKLYQQTIPSGGGVDDDELDDLLDIVLYDIPDDNTSEFVSVLDNLNKIEYSLQHKNISPDNKDELQNLNNVKLDIIDINDRLENIEEETLIHNAFNKIIEICKKGIDNASLKEVVEKVTVFKNLLMNLIIELKNNLPEKSSLEVWENFMDSDGVLNVTKGSALAHIVDFHMKQFKYIYQAPRIGTRSSVTEETESGKKSPIQDVTAEIIAYEFTPFENLERYLKDFQLYEDEETGKDVLGFQYWKDVVNEIYDRYHQSIPTKITTSDQLEEMIKGYEEDLEKCVKENDSLKEENAKLQEENEIWEKREKGRREMRIKGAFPRTPEQRKIHPLTMRTKGPVKDSKLVEELLKTPDRLRADQQKVETPPTGKRSTKERWTKEDVEKFKDLSVKPKETEEDEGQEGGKKKKHRRKRTKKKRRKRKKTRGKR